MADFTFDTDNAARSAGSEANGASSGEPRRDSGTGSTTDANNGNEGQNNGARRETGEGVGSFGASEIPRKRRGRKPYPRDEFGNIIRPASATNAGTGSTNKGGKEGLDIKNDREKVKANITGLHAMAAVLTKQPILNLNDNEATALTNSLCDVADYHNFNLISAGGAFGLYASLATTAYMIYVPRMIKIKQDRAAENAKPANPGGFQFRQPPNREERNGNSTTGTMDYTNDVMH